MRSRSFRFDPPEVPLSAELRWILGRSFGPRTTELGPVDPEQVLALSGRLGLRPRIAARADFELVERELGFEAADRLRAVRQLAIARELWFEETETALARVAAGLGLEPALLKGRALTLGGDAAPGARPASDIDLLVPTAALGELRTELLRAGFEEVRDASYEHHGRPLRLPGGAPVELHRHLPGVRLDARRFATWEALERAGLLARRAVGGRHANLRVPARELLTAHAIVHALAQHGMTTSYPGWILIGDLIDLGTDAHQRDGAGLASTWRSWVERELSSEEVDAALTLAGRLAAGQEPAGVGPDDRATRLASHFTACALDADYGRALRSRWLEVPLSDRPRPLARLRLLLRAFAPPIDDSPAGRDQGPVERALLWLARPFVLATKAARARAARLRVASRGVARRD